MKSIIFQEAFCLSITPSPIPSKRDLTIIAVTWKLADILYATSENTSFECTYIPSDY